MPISIFPFLQRLGTLPSKTPNLVTGERGKKNTSKRRASNRKQAFNKSKSCRTTSCWLAPRLRLAVFIGAFRRRKNLSLCVVRVLMPAKTPKGKLRFRRTKGKKKKRTYSIHHCGSHYFSQNYTAQMRGIRSEKARAAARS
jgi:hypothetical protein